MTLIPTVASVKLSSALAFWDESFNSFTRESLWNTFYRKQGCRVPPLHCFLWSELEGGRDVLDVVYLPKEVKKKNSHLAQKINVSTKEAEIR